MNQFGRALKLALAHRVNVAACVLTSIAVALLWMGSLSAVFWVVDVVMIFVAAVLCRCERIAKG